MLLRKIRFYAFFSCLLCVHHLQAAPRIPNELTENGLIYCTNASGFTFNPQTTDASTSMNVVTAQVYDKLFEINNHSAKLTPSLAQSYWFSNDGKDIFIQLRQGVKFHHTPWFTPTRDFNAEDVVFSLNRALGNNDYLASFEENDNKYKNVQYQIFHQQAKKARFPYFESIKLNQKIKRVIAINPYLVKIELFKPDSSILSHLASQYAIIFSQEYAYQLNADDNLALLDNRPVGTGAYQVKDYVYNQYVRLIANENYWQQQASIKNIIVDLSADGAGRVLKFLNNECQLAAYPEISQLETLKQETKGYSVQSVEEMNLAYLAFNFKRPLMQDLTIRQAISQGLNRARIVERIYHNTATVANNIIPNISWAATLNTPEFAYDYNPQQAKTQLKNKKLQLEMWVLNEELMYNPSPIKMAQLIKQDLQQIGIELNIRLITRTALINQLHNQAEDYDLILTGWLAGSLDPDGFMRPILSCSTVMEITNLSNWCNANFEQAMDNALITTDLTEQAQFYSMAQELVLSQIPIVPIANVKRILLVNDKVTGVAMMPFGGINFATLSLKKGENNVK